MRIRTMILFAAVGYVAYLWAEAAVHYGLV